MSVQELLEKIENLDWVDIKEKEKKKKGKILGGILDGRGKKKTDFSLFYNETYLKLTFGKWKKGLRFVDFIAKERGQPYLKIGHRSLFDFNMPIYMWEKDNEKFVILYKDYKQMVDANEGNFFGYKSIHLMTP